MIFRAIVGGELRYFSGCIRNDRAVKPDRDEALADLIVIEAIIEALKTGGAVAIEPV